MRLSSASKRPCQKTGQTRCRPAMGAVLGLLFIPAMANAESAPSSVVVFGDSLSDTGNFAALFGGLFPPPPYFEGRFSNGPLWVERFSDRLGATITANNAFAGDDSTDLVNTRLPNFLQTQPIADPDALHVVFIGGNDLSDNAIGVTSVPSIRTAVADRIAQNVRQTITQLESAGATQFLLMNLSDIGATPEADFISASSGNPDIPAGLRLASIETNQRLAAEAAVLRDAFDIDIFEFDTFALFETLLSQPDAFGLTNTENNVLQPDITLIGDPDEFLFWDNLHPTARAHEILGDAVYAAFIPAPSTAALITLGLMAVPRRRTAG